MVAENIVRCGWAKGEAYVKYHDEEWGVPSHDDRHLFEMLILEGAQAGLSWSTILNRREGYRAAFHGFDVQRCASISEEEIGELLQNPGIIRNKLKIFSARSNARAFIELQGQKGSFAAYLWSFVDDRPILNKFKSLEEIPAKTAISDALSKDLAKRGFKFVGSTICYAYMQAVGLVNDHVESCFRHGQR